jgi:Flp pilus assembly pilin Flp
MFRKLMKNKKAQQTAEYALLISLVVAAIIAMQTYAQRTIQARIRDASSHLTQQTNALGTTAQYEPYYLTTGYETVNDQVTEQIQDNSVGGFQTFEDSVRTRVDGGFQESSYDASMNGIINGI